MLGLEHSFRKVLALLLVSILVIRIAPNSILSGKDNLLENTQDEILSDLSNSYFLDVISPVHFEHFKAIQTEKNSSLFIQFDQKYPNPLIVSPLMPPEL